MTLELNPQQFHAVKESIKWWNGSNNQKFEVSGPAGSGKTTIVYELVRQLGLKKEEVLFMAYVGKAAMVLSMKGNFAKTIHSSIYDLSVAPKLDTEGQKIEKNGRVVTIPVFKRKEKLDPKIKLIVVDEGSFPDMATGTDIMSFGLPVLVLGDLDQLPPIFGESYFLKNPDIILTQLMRQAEDSEIVYFSQLARKGQKIPFGKYNNSLVIPYEDLKDEHLLSRDMIICGKNETRENINDYYRHELLKRPRGVPVVGDKIICRQNNWKLSVNDNIHLVNGLIGYIDDIYKETYNKKAIGIDFRPDFLDNAFTKVMMDFPGLFMHVGSKESAKRSYFNKFQFAWAISCHLAQGSQSPNVMYYRERIGSHIYQRKLDYTAITRAEKSIIIAQ